MVCQQKAASELLQDEAILDLIWDSKLNEVSVIQEGSDDVFFVVNVTSETEPRERRLDEVKKLVISDYKRTEAIKEARLAAEAAVANPQTDRNIAPSPAFRRNGIGLDHEAAGLIANVAFAQNGGDIQVVETGREAIAVRTIDIIPASDDELRETTKLVLTVMNNAIRDDMTNLLLLKLSQKHDLQLITRCPTALLGTRLMAPASVAFDNFRTKFNAGAYSLCIVCLLPIRKHRYLHF